MMQLWNNFLSSVDDVHHFYVPLALFWRQASDIYRFSELHAKNLFDPDRKGESKKNSADT
jgi:hypothetical protein